MCCVMAQLEEIWNPQFPGNLEHQLGLSFVVVKVTPPNFSRKETCTQVNVREICFLAQFGRNRGPPINQSV